MPIETFSERAQPQKRAVGPENETYRTVKQQLWDSHLEVEATEVVARCAVSE